MQKNFEALKRRADELEQLLQQPELSNNPERSRSLTKEYRELQPALTLIHELESIEKALAEAQATLKSQQESELTALAEEEVKHLTSQKQELENRLADHLRPKDPWEGKDIIVEVRAGVGGEEAALFAADLFRMYARYAERHGWSCQLVATSRTGIGGLKEAIFEIRGREAFRKLKFESGVHRVQRIPATEKSGRIHTSTATVAILPEPQEVEVEIKPNDLKIDVTTSSGHGGQSVNTTYSAVRMTHLPTGITVSCQDERSQKQNKERALKILRARLFALENEKRHREESERRRSQVGSGDRAEKIRTYNIPQDRVTDHRLKKSFPAVQSIFDGQLDPIIQALEKPTDDRS